MDENKAKQEEIETGAQMPEEGATAAENAPQSEVDVSLEEQVLMLDDKYRRLAAEYDNFRKRTQKERDSLAAFIVRDTITKFLPAVDSLTLAMSHSKDEATTAGLAMIQKSVEDALKSIGVEEIAAGGEFNPDLHNAVMHIEDPNLEQNTVAEVLQKGYIYKETVIRHAMVKVAN